VSRLINTTTMTVDGVTDVGPWYVVEGEHDRAARRQVEGAAGMVLGRKTYEGLAGFWPTQTGEWADLLNPLPKYVASRTLRGPLEWTASLIDGDVITGVPQLKQEADGDLFLIGSASSHAASSPRTSSTRSGSGSIRRSGEKVPGRTGASRSGSACSSRRRTTRE
jgi:dihydrofolate reductase